MTFADESFDVVFDKGTIDALLSHGHDEVGTKHTHIQACTL